MNMLMMFQIRLASKFADKGAMVYLIVQDKNDGIRDEIPFM